MNTFWLWLRGWRQLPGYAIWHDKARRYQAVRLNSGRWLLIVADDPMDDLGWTTYRSARELTERAK